MTLQRRRFVQLSALGTVGFAGCMGDGGDDGNETDGGDGGENASDDGEDGASDDSEDGAMESAAQQEYPDYDWSQLEGEDATATDTITLSNSQFDPQVARVPVGTEITVTNEDITPHTITVPGADIDEEIGANGEVTVQFDETGTYDYVCTKHPPSMLGRVVVEEDVEV